MVSVSHDDFVTLLNLTEGTDISAVDAEAIIDHAIDLLNLYSDTALDNMSGTAGSKDVTLTSTQRGAVLEVAKAVYYRDYRDIRSTSISELSLQSAQIDDPDKVARRLSSHLVTCAFNKT